MIYILIKLLKKTISCLSEIQIEVTFFIAKPDYSGAERLAPKYRMFLFSPRGGAVGGGRGRGPLCGGGGAAQPLSTGGAGPRDPLPRVCLAGPGGGAGRAWRMASLPLQLLVLGAVLGVALAAAALILVRRGVGDRRGPGLAAVLETGPQACSPPRTAGSSTCPFSPCCPTPPPSLDRRIPSTFTPLSFRCSFSLWSFIALRTQSFGTCLPVFPTPWSPDPLPIPSLSTGFLLGLQPLQFWPRRGGLEPPEGECSLNSLSLPDVVKHEESGDSPDRCHVLQNGRHQWIRETHWGHRRLT